MKGRLDILLQRKNLLFERDFAEGKAVVGVLQGLQLVHNVVELLVLCLLLGLLLSKQILVALNELRVALLKNLDRLSELL